MIPLKYNVGNLTSRRVSTLMTILGIGVVIAVMISMMALKNGVHSAIVSSGSNENLMVMREGAEAELSSSVSKDAFRIIRALPGVAKDPGGAPMVSPELVIIFKIPKKDDPKGSNVLVRGVTPAAFAMRPYVKIVDGRMFRPGVNEIIVARRIRDRFVNTAIGDSFKFGSQTYNIVGVFDAQGTAFDSEMWCDTDFLGQARKRDAYSSVIVRPIDREAFESIKAAIKNDNRLKLAVKSEYQYYDDQTSGLAGIVVLVRIVTFFMTIGAILGTMNTMFSAIASRGRELATMRALGFNRRAILLSVIVESAFISLLGGIAGLLLALPVNAISTGTTNFQTFSEVAFNFRVDGHVALNGILIALIAGVIGGMLPALRAARTPITTALREI
ncbi:MAG: putative transport system permease protein [Thermoanaerobaculia bacterium]|jgi:ABC-type lipoprotein release transport system permease subunit|nr:putative transport system permease protein [Thermoanaerobaculia bacterium]